MVRWVVGSILHGVDPLSYFSFQPVLHDLCNKGRGMCYPVCVMTHIKENHENAILATTIQSRSTWFLFDVYEENHESAMLANSIPSRSTWFLFVVYEENHESAMLANPHSV